MRKFIHILIPGVLALSLFAPPVAAILINPEEYGLANCLNYLISVLINLGLFGFVYWKAVPAWLARNQNARFYQVIIVAILVSALLKTLINVWLSNWEGQVFTLSQQLPFIARLGVSAGISFVFVSLAVLSRFTVDWYKNRQRILELELAEAEKSGKQEPERPVGNLSDILFIRSEYKIHRIKLSSVLFVEGLNDYLVIQTQKEKILSLMSFKDLDPFMKPPEFIRVHKSFVIALSKIDSVERSLINIGSRQIPIGKSYRDAFFETLKKYQAGG